MGPVQRYCDPPDADIVILFPSQTGPGLLVATTGLGCTIIETGSEDILHCDELKFPDSATTIRYSYVPAAVVGVTEATNDKLFSPGKSDHVPLLKRCCH